MKATKAIKEAMERENIVQSSLANKIGVTPQALNMRLGYDNISADKMYEMLNAMGYEIVIRPKQKKHKDSEIVIDLED